MRSGAVAFSMTNSDQKQAVLYRLFEWASRARSSLALVGIANSIDLTDRFLPRLRQKLREFAETSKAVTSQQLRELASAGRTQR